MIDDLLTELKRPFHPSAVSWKPQSVKDGKGMAIAYCDVRAYQDRLDEICGLDWATSYLPWGEGRIICHLTIAGITRSATGEADSQSESREIAGTSAESQAFKRACSAFGLGRYIYSLPSVWVEMDGKQFSDRAKARLDGVILNHYKRAMSGSTGSPTATVAEPVEAESDADMRKLFEDAGAELYGERWAAVSAHNAAKVSDGTITDPAALSSEQVRKLLKGMQGMQRAKSAAA